MANRLSHGFSRAKKMPPPLGTVIVRTGCHTFSVWSHHPSNRGGRASASAPHETYVGVPRALFRLPIAASCRPGQPLHRLQCAALFSHCIIIVGAQRGHLLEGVSSVSVMRRTHARVLTRGWHRCYARPAGGAYRCCCPATCTEFGYVLDGNTSQHCDRHSVARQHGICGVERPITW